MGETGPVAIQAGHRLNRRLDTTGHVEFWDAELLAPPSDRRLLLRFPAHETRWPPWAWPGVATCIVHPNVVRLYELMTLENRVVASLEYVDGIDLRAVILRERLPPHLAVHLVRETLTGLVAALDARAPDSNPLGGVHGWLCPRAVHVSTQGSVKVWGFGIGRIKPEPTPKLSLDEPVRYATPEAALGHHHPDPLPPADVFSAGQLLFELLTGQPLIEAGAPLEYLRALTAPTTSLARPTPSASPELAIVLRRMLAPRPELRFPSAREALHALRQVPDAPDFAGCSAELAALARRPREP